MKLTLSLIAVLLAVLLAALPVGAFAYWRLRDPGPPNTVVRPDIIFDEGNFYLRVEEKIWSVGP